MTEHELENKAWNIMNEIYEAVRERAPHVINTTAWYDFGCPIILKALKDGYEVNK